MQPSHIETLNALITLAKNCCMSVAVQRHKGNPPNGCFDFFVSNHYTDIPDITIWVKHGNHLAQVLEILAQQLNLGDEVEDHVWGFNP